MGKKKSFLYIFLMLVLIIMAVVGCHGGSTINKNNDNEKKLTGTIKIWCSENSKASINNSAVLFKKQYPELNIEITALSEEELKGKLSKKNLAEEDLPHIIEVDGYDVSYMVQDYPEVFTSVDKAMDKMKDKFLPWKLVEMTYKKKLYAIPWNTEPKVLIYNKKLADTYNINPFEIKTWLEFSDLGILLKEQSMGNLKLIALRENADGNLYKSMLRQFRKALYSMDDNIKLPEENKYVLSTIKGLYKEELVYTLKEGEDPFQVLKEGKALCILGDSSDISRIKRDPKFNAIVWEVHSLPAFEYGGKRSVHGEGTAIMLTRKTENDKAAIEFLNFLLTDFDSVTFALNDAGIIPSIPVLYNLPEFNASINNFQNIKLWRFIAEQSKEEEAVLYDHRYEEVAKQLLQMEQEAIEGQDLEMLIALQEMELNSTLNEASADKPE